MPGSTRRASRAAARELGVTVLYVSHEFGAVEHHVERLVLVRGDDRLRRAAVRAAGRLARPLARPCLSRSSCASRSRSGAVIGVLAPAVGFFLVQRRMSLIGDGIGHVAFAGRRARAPARRLADPDRARRRAIAGGVAIEWLRSRRLAAGDQALALVFYTGIAAGVVLVSAAGSLNVNLFQYLFGSILTVTREDLVVVALLGAAGLACIALLYRALSAVVIDEEGARVSGVPVGALNIALAALAALTVALSMRIVGVLLIAALMVLPVTAATRIGWSLASTLLLSIAIGLGSVFLRADDVVLRGPAAGRDDRARRGGRGRRGRDGAGASVRDAVDGRLADDLRAARRHLLTARRGCPGRPAADDEHVLVRARDAVRRAARLVDGAEDLELLAPADAREVRRACRLARPVSGGLGADLGRAARAARDERERKQEEPQQRGESSDGSAGLRHGRSARRVHSPGAHESARSSARRPPKGGCGGAGRAAARAGRTRATRGREAARRST